MSEAAVRKPADPATGLPVTPAPGAISAAAAAQCDKKSDTHGGVVQRTLQRITSHAGVVGYIVLQPRSGAILQAEGFGGDQATIRQYADKISAFTHVTHSAVRTLDHDDDLTFLRMRWRQREIIVAPDVGKEYTLIVVHDYSDPAGAAGAAGAQKADTPAERAEKALSSPTAQMPSGTFGDE